MTMNMNIDPSYEAIDEDDVFYAEMRRQILLLTADDDEDYRETNIFHSVSSSKTGSNRPVGNFSSSLQYESYFGSWERDNANSVPTWLANLWRYGNGNGTGVFIPRVSKSRRRHMSGIHISIFISAEFHKVSISLLVSACFSFYETNIFTW